jgi:transposase
MVKKLLQQRKRTGQIGARHAYSGRKPFIVQAHEDQMRLLLGRKPDMTLKELREALDLDCSLPAIHYVLSDMGLTYKKRHSALPLGHFYIARREDCSITSRTEKPPYEAGAKARALC